MSEKNIITAFAGSGIVLQGQGYMDYKIPLSQATNNTGHDAFTIYNGGIKIGEGVNKIQVSARIGYDSYSQQGELDLVVYKNSSVAMRVYDSCKLINQKQSIILNPKIIDVQQNDVIYLYIAKNSNNNLTITGGIPTNLTIEKVTGQSTYVPDTTSYTELQYIESSGTQYIDTGFNPNGNTRVVCKWGSGTKNGVIFGAYNGSWTSGFGLYGNEASSNGYYWRHYFSNDNTYVKKQTTMTVNMNKGSLVMNGSTVFSNNTKSNSTSYPMYIFAGNWSGSRAEQPVNIKLYYFKIYNNGTLIRDFIPCKHTIDGVVCLYDKVNKVFYYNAGVGTFTAGPVVS